MSQSSAEDYEEMPIGEYGKAMLRGMGWKEGTGIGKNNKGQGNASIHHSRA